MQNWNQWQLPAGGVTTSMPQPPVGYAAPGADPVAMMHAYMQYYNQPAPSGYTAEQWTAAQQQNWAQWQQWQQQYQQWQAQYGEKYQETMKQMSSQAVGFSNQPPPLPSVQLPPLPKDDAKPPLPSNTYQFTNMPPPHQNNLPLFPAKQSASNVTTQSNALTYLQNPPLPPNQPPLPPENSDSKENVAAVKRSTNTVSESSSAKKLKVDDEELTEAEKTFDAQFKQWEEQFNKWKQQNANHPDKTQYKEYEAKWTSWREKLIERREQMRRKREQQKQAAGKSEGGKNKNLPGGDKIMNILSSSENQGLINNLLGIGKTLGLTGKQNNSVLPPPPPPSQAAITNNQPSVSSFPTQDAPQQTTAVTSSNAGGSSWTASQWAAQYNSRMNMSGFSGFHPMSSMVPLAFSVPTNQLPPPNFTQPPPNLSNTAPNFSQPPPGFGSSDTASLLNSNIRSAPPKMQEKDKNFFASSTDRIDSDMNRMGMSRLNSMSLLNNLDRPMQSNNYVNENSASRNQSAVGVEHFGRDTYNRSLNDQEYTQFKSNDEFPMRNDRFNRENENYDRADTEGFQSDRFRRENRNDMERESNQFHFQKQGLNVGNDRFMSTNDRFSVGSERIPAGTDHCDTASNRFGLTSDRRGGGEHFGSIGDRFGGGNQRFSTSDERFIPESDRMSSAMDRCGPNNDRFGPGNNRYGNDRFAPNNERFGPGNDRLTSASDRFGLSNEQAPSTIERFNRVDRFEQKDPDNRRDNFTDNLRMFNRNNQFEQPNVLAPELRKLMEKRRTAVDVFKPSFLDSDKTSTIGSLSESFKKIAGDSPFITKVSTDFGQKDFNLPRGNSNCGSRAANTFGNGNFRGPITDFRARGPNDLRPVGIPEFGPRSMLNMGARHFNFNVQDTDAFGFKGSANNCVRDDVQPNAQTSLDFNERVGREHETKSNFNSQPRQDLIDNEQKSNIGHVQNNSSINDSNIAPEKTQEYSDGTDKPSDTKEKQTLPELNKSNIDTSNNLSQKDSQQEHSSSQKVSLEKPPWINAQFSEDKFLEKNVNHVEQNKNDTAFRSSLEHSKNDSSTEHAQTSLAEDRNEKTNKESIKKSEDLPFMGENDPKPEDLNMEPPPELPNLGPIPSNHDNKCFDAAEKTDKPFDTKDSSIGVFSPGAVCFDQRFPVHGGPNNFSKVPGDKDVNKPGHFDSRLTPRGLNDEDSASRSISSRGANINSGRQCDGPFENRLDDGVQFRPHGSTDRVLEPTNMNDKFHNERKMATLNDEAFTSRSCNDGPFGSRSNDNSLRPWQPNQEPFGQRMSNSDPFTSRNISDQPLGPRFITDSSFRGPEGSFDHCGGLFSNHGSNEGFASRGFDDGQFGPRRLNEGPFGSRNSSETRFGLRSYNDEAFGLRGPGDALFGPRGYSGGSFGPRGPIERSFGLRGPPDGPFKAQGYNDSAFNTHTTPEGFLGLRGPNDGTIGPKGPKDISFGPRGFMDKPFGRRDMNDDRFSVTATTDRQLKSKGPFGGVNESPFSSRSSHDGIGTHNRNEDLFGSRSPLGIKNCADYKARGQLDVNIGSRSLTDSPRSGTPSFMAARSDDARIDEFKGKYSDQYGENIFTMRRDCIGQDSGKFGGSQNTIASNLESQSVQGKSSFSNINTGDLDHKGRYDSGGIDKQMASYNESSTRVGNDNRTDNLGNKINEMVGANTKSVTGDFKSRSDEITDLIKFSGSHIPIKQLMDRQSHIRGGAPKEFCIERQFNYNHGGTAIDKKVIEYSPMKTIDYGHTSRATLQDHLTLVQSFDYGHGNLKPIVPDHELCPQKDFRHWEESEQNLKEYTKRMEEYENAVTTNSFKQPEDWLHTKSINKLGDNRSFEKDLKNLEKDDYKKKGDKTCRNSDKDQDNKVQSDRSTNKDRIQERTERPGKDASKENDKNDERSKGSSSWKESTNKNTVEPQSQDVSISDGQHNVLDTPVKTLELAKTPNCTMVDDLLCPPGRQSRPPKIAIILRGPPGSGKSFVAKLIKDKEVEQGGSAPRILSLDDYFLVEKEVESQDDNGKKVIVKEMVYEYEEGMEQSYIASLIKAFKKNITDGFFNFIILDCINEKISDYEEMWSFAKSKGFKVYVCEMEMDAQICLRRNTHNRSEDEINRIIDYFEPTPSYHQKLDVNSMLQEQAIEEVDMEDSQQTQEEGTQQTEDSQDSQEDVPDTLGVSKWERMEAEDKLDRLDGLAKRKNEGKPQTMEDFLQVPDYYNMEDTSGKKRVRWADLEERKEQEKMRAVGFVVGHTNWDRMMDPTKGSSALTRTKCFSLS